MRRIIIVVLALGCDVHGTRLPDGSAQVDGAQEINRARPESALDASPEPTADAMPEAPAGDAPPDPLCVGKADNERCGTETCAGTIATHFRCRSGACVELIEECVRFYCAVGTVDRYRTGRCYSDGLTGFCLAALSGPTLQMCPAEQVCMPITPVVPSGAAAACVAAPDGGTD